MRGLRKHEDPDFESFFSVVQKSAQEINCVFFVDSEEGHEFEKPGLSGSNLSGWLVPVTLADEFDLHFQKSKQFDDIPDRFAGYFRFAKWEDSNGSMTIHFC